jgi:Tol biopolymer transport system component
MRVWRWWIAVVVAVLAGTGPVASAPASLPGENGKIAYFSAQFGAGGIYQVGVWTIAPDGTGETQLLDGATSPAWSPDGSRLAYVLVSVDGASSEVYTANADGSDARQLTDDGQRSGSPTWSPDGSSIAWSSNRDGSYEIWAMASDGSGKRRVTSLPDDWRASKPSWSPLGDEISYTVRIGDEDEQSVRIIAPYGANDRQLTPAGFDGWSADWAPDGSRLVFVSREEQIGNALYTIRPDGTGLQRIPNLQGEHFGGADGMGISSPAFSPDGTRVLYQYIVCVGGRCGEGITLAEADGSTKGTLTAGVRFENFGSPAWQPLNPNHPPDCSAAAADPQALWPPNKHVHTVSVAGATDPDGEAVTLRITGVSHDEGGAADWQPGAAPDQVQLRATRDPQGDGRVYTIAFEAEDGHGGTCAGAATVTVPRHKR